MCKGLNKNQIEIIAVIIIKTLFIIMFWRQLLVSLFLNIKQSTIQTYKLKLSTDYLPDPAPSVGQEPKPEVPETSFTLLKYNNGIVDKQYSGCDCRFGNETYRETETELLYNITRNFHKMTLLRYLESPDISLNDKIETIRRNQEESKNIGINLKEGGLFKDWDFEFETKK
jgi:hypothetical protein